MHGYVHVYVHVYVNVYVHVDVHMYMDVSCSDSYVTFNHSAVRVPTDIRHIFIVIVSLGSRK